MKYQLRLNGAPLLSGDASSVAVVFNNLSGANITGPEYQDYLAFMRQQHASTLAVGKDTVAMYANDKLVNECLIGAGLRITSSDVAKHEAACLAA